MKIYLGTTSETKIAIIKEGIRDLEPYEFVPVEVDSGITDQPLDEITTITGSLNRANRAVQGKDFDIGMGLEGGLIKINNLLHLICVVSIVDSSGNVFTGESGRLPLPKDVSDNVLKGEQFGSAIRDFQKNLGSDVPPEIYELIEELIARKKSFLEALQIALIKFRFKGKIF